MIPELTNHLWQSTLFAVAVALLTLAFRKNRAQVRYWLWLSASLKFLVPFALLISLGSRLEWAPAAKTVATPAVTIAMQQISEPFPDVLPMAPTTRANRDWAPIALLGVWTCGFGVIALTRFRGWLRIRGAVRASSPVDIPATVEVRSTPGLLEPGVVGLSRPVLLLPSGIAERLTPRQLEAVLAHELCHIRRRDNLTAAVHMVVEAVFWFHPLVWWIGARLMEERERACDEEVLSLGSEPRDYAEAILNICKLYAESPLVCVSGVSGSNLKKRIEAIMINRSRFSLHFGKKVVLAVAAIAALATPIIVGIMNTPVIQAQSRPQAIPRFEVVSIRPCQVGDAGGGSDARGVQKKSGANAQGPSSSPGRLSTPCQTVEALIRDAYILYASGELRGDPSAAALSGGPNWIQSDRYMINARAEGSPSVTLMRGPMLQAVLEDRFKLRIHRESREAPVYALTVAKNGPKLQPFQSGSCTLSGDFWRPHAPLPAGQKYCQVLIRGGQVPNNRTLEAQGAGLADFAKLLSFVMDRAVLDKTGIKGRFDFQVEFAKDENTPIFKGVTPDSALIPAASDPEGPSIFAALQQKLGLKLEPAKGPREFLVIDSVERPSRN